MSGIVYVGGPWVTNIGNLYFNVGAHYALTAACSDKAVYLMPDITESLFRGVESYDPLADVDADLWVFSGPLFSSGILRYRPLFDHLRAHGKRIAFLSVGLWKYSPEEWSQVRAFLEQYLDIIEFISTRDRRTFSRVNELGPASYDGICGSMFLTDAIAVPRLDREPYIVLNFPKDVEPTVSIGETGDWEFDFPAGPSSLSGWTSWPRRLARGLRMVSSQKSGHLGQRRVGEFDIVRTQSRRFTRTRWKMFDRAGMHYSDLPYGYLSIYRNADVVFTDRVHTAASTLILGGTAQYFMTTDRARDGRWTLLERVGASEVTRRPTQLDAGAISAEKDAQLDFLRQQIG